MNRSPRGFGALTPRPAPRRRRLARNCLTRCCLNLRASGRWIGDLAFGWFFTAQGENDKYARQIRNSAGIAVFVGEAADKAHWVEVGRAYERFALHATALGIRNAFVNQPVEVAAVRAPFATALGLSGQRPDLVVRFGRGPTVPASLRRPVESVLV